MKATEINGFKLQKKMAKGDCCQVFKAMQISLGRSVSLKVLKPSLSENPAEIARFKLQGGATLNLRHANIVQTYASSESNGVYYIVRELVEGRHLAQIIRRHHGLPLAQVLHIMQSLVSALHAAWAHDGTIHADLRPENVLIGHDGMVKLTDFSGLTEDSSPTLLPALADTRMGSPSYIAPELLHRRKSIDFRADIYSLGALLYQMLTGYAPFERLRASERSEAHCSGYLRNPLDIDRSISTAATTLCQKMMIKDPSGRYASWDELKADLDMVLARRIPPRGPLDSYESSVADYDNLRSRTGLRRADRIKFALIYLFIGLFALLNIYLIAELSGYFDAKTNESSQAAPKGTPE